MTVTADQPQAAFRIDMLWNDSRYRSAFLQTIAVVLVMLLISFLVSNVISNLAALGKEFSFDFATAPASYDINQKLIAYDSRASHSTAAVVGILNTLLVAVMGCLLATLIGVLAGVARLSRNFVVSGLMTLYIEIVRNVPLLIQILLLAAVLDEILPAPRAAEPILGAFVATNRGFYFPAPIFGPGSAVVVWALVLAVVAAVCFGRWARLRQQDTGEALPVFWIKTAIILGVPLLAWAAMGAPISFETPTLQGFNYQGGVFARNSLIALWLALSIYTGAFIAETVRAGILSVSRGQSEAAGALGLRPGLTMSLVVLPQALRVIIPPMISQFLNLTKNSSLALAIGYMDATGTLGGITLNQTGKEMETLLLLMAFYLTISLTISAIMNLYNEQVKLVERTSSAGFGFSFVDLFSSMTGRWESLKKGDARMRPGFGVAGWLNAVVLVYLLWFAALINYTFLADITPERMSYFDWSTPRQVAMLGMIVFSFAALVTCLFKHFRFLDFAVLELVVLILALLCGTPFAQIVPGYGGPVVVFVAVLLRLAVIGYTIFGARPNLTFLNRVRGA